MEFQSDAQKATYEKIGQYMKELFGELVGMRTDFPGYYLIMGWAVVNAVILPWGNLDLRQE